MSVGSVRGKEFYEKIGYERGYKSKERNTRGFLGNLTGQANQKTEDTTKNQTSVQTDYRSGKVASDLFFQNMGRVNRTAVTECSVRRISYQESDYVKVFPAEGYTLKAQADPERHIVYIEQKNEDGTYQAYEVDMLQVSEYSKSPVTQAAFEAWIAVRKKSDDTSDAAEQDFSNLTEFEKRLMEFQAYVKERIKEGPPKIMIGGAEFSEEEWERLIRKIDQDIDAYKEELRERIRKQKEASAVWKTSGGVSDEEEETSGSLQQAAGVLAGDKAGEGLSVSENEALEGLENNAPRGRSLLARFSGTKKAPYSYLADATGKIVYKGVTFFCDDEKQQICLGDMNDTKNVINIPLAKGGCLRVNRENIGDLAKAISMFSPEDIGRIMRAIAQDNKAREVQWEIEELEEGI